jgi:hypothetical protein
VLFGLKRVFSLYFLLSIRRLFADSATVSPSASKNPPNRKEEKYKRTVSLVLSFSYSGHELITEPLSYMATTTSHPVKPPHFSQTRLLLLA